MSDMENKRIFEDFQCVDCNECARYWDSSCDGVKNTPNGSQKPCNSFLATRSVVIPAQIEALTERLKWLRVSVTLIEIVVVLHLVGHIFGWV